jgi:hypothetical protein
LVLAFPAGEMAKLFNHFVITAIDPDGFTVNQRIGHRLPRLVQDATERGPRYTHALPGYLMGQTVKISKPQRFPLIHGNTHLGEVNHGDAPRLEIAYFRIERHESVFSGSSHQPSNKAYARLRAVILSTLPCQAVPFSD